MKMGDEKNKDNEHVYNPPKKCTACNGSGISPFGNIRSGKYTDECSNCDGTGYEE